VPVQRAPHACAATPPPFPPLRRQTFTWATYQSNNILTLRSVANNATVQCYYARMTGSGDNRAVTILTLGGAPVSANFQLQCDPTNYEQYANYLTQPVCRTPATGGPSAYNSTTVQSLNYRGGGVPESNGAAAVAASAVTALLGAALVALAAAGVGA